MPLVPYNLKTLKRAMTLAKNAIKASGEERNGRILTLSCPDLIAKRSDLEEIFERSFVTLPVRHDAEKILNWHKAHARTLQVFDTSHLFNQLGFEHTVIDLVNSRPSSVGEVWVHDLSEPIEQPMKDILDKKFDIVFDCISNQCFNVAQVWKTMVECCRVGGLILSVTPVQMINQGFWDISPTTYQDFFRNNGFDIIEHSMVVGVYEQKHKIEFNNEQWFKRMRDVPDDAMNLFLASRRVAVPVQWPVMSKFIKYPDCLLDNYNR